MNELKRHTSAASMVVPLALLAACGNSLSGIYGKPDGMHLEFQSNGKVEIAMLGTAQEARYVVEDGKVKISAGDGKAGALVLKINDKGCLEGGMMFGTLCKQ